MSKRLLSIMLMISTLALTLSAQEKIEDPFEATRVKGDQSISIDIGGFVPLFVLDNTGTPISPSNMSIGTAFSVQYRYMLGKNFAIGGSGAGSFVTTVGGGTLFLAPIAITGAWIWSREPMEYEVSAELGMNIMRLYGNGLISPIAKFGGGISRFVDSSWSIGFKLNWWFVPEIHLGAYSNLTSYANFLEFSIGANYHF
ncbi:MAG TPA: hypothetical protein PK775_00590 [Rectinema sp.]|nr:hypothetical protein [Rectinema sp.]HQL15773.1 hypothetical protein [Rectinema sp.]HQQ72915.1 hypothetical protein [Rectinema sp.]